MNKDFWWTVAISFVVVLIVLFFLSRTTIGLNLFYDVQGKGGQSQ